jgi:hypothetical protein
MICVKKVLIFSSGQRHPLSKKICSRGEATLSSGISWQPIQVASPLPMGDYEPGFSKKPGS